MKVDLLAMDFDGVIADSILECAVAGYNAYSTYRGKDNQINTPDKINLSQLNIFRNTRPFIRSGEDYLYLFQAISEGINIDNQENFDSFKNRYIDRRNSYYELFNLARQHLIKNHFNKWIALNPLYSGMTKFLQSVIKKIHIVSTKSSKYIIEILSYNSILLNSDNIHSTEIGISKSDILLKIIDNAKINSQNIVFIDDHIDTLQKIEKTNVHRMLAGWGYNNYQQRSKCYKLNIELVELQHFYEKFNRRIDE